MYNIIKRFLKYFILNVKYRGKVSFPLSCNIGCKSFFEGMNRISSDTSFSGSIGYCSNIGDNCSIHAKIGRFTSIAPYVRTNNGRHPYTYPYATTSPAFYSLNKQNGATFATRQMFEENRGVAMDKEYSIVIGNDCWIGQNVFIVGGVTIGDGAVVLANAAVVNDIPPYAIAGGVPAKVIKYRYDDATISFLLKTKWWNNDEKWFKINWELMCDIDKLKKKYSNLN